MTEQPVQLHQRNALASFNIEWVCAVCQNHMVTPVKAHNLDAIAASPPRCQCSNLMELFDREAVKKQVAEATQAETKDAQERGKALEPPAKPKRKHVATRKPVGGSKPGAKKPRNASTTAKPAQPTHTHTVDIKGKIK